MSILQTIKKLLGIDNEYDIFDQDLIIYINSVFSILNQMGVGPEEGFAITGNDEQWTDFIPNNILYETVKTYMYLKVRLLFDPPSGAASDATNNMIAELEYRLHVNCENDKT